MAQSGVTVEPVGAGFDAAVLDELGRRLSAARLATDGGTAWEQGVPRSWLAGVLADWQRFDTAAFRTRLDRLAHSRAEHHRGGHFPAVAEPRLLAQELRDAFRPLRA